MHSFECPWSHDSFVACIQLAWWTIGFYYTMHSFGCPKFNDSCIACMQLAWWTIGFHYTMHSFGCPWSHDSFIACIQLAWWTIGFHYTMHSFGCPNLMTLSLLAYSWPGGPSAFTTLCTLWYLVVVRRRRSPSRRNRWKSLAPLSPSPFVSRPVIIGNARLHMCVTCGAFLHQVSRLDVALSKTLCVSYSCSTPVLYLQL